MTGRTHRAIALGTALGSICIPAVTDTIFNQADTAELKITGISLFLIIKIKKISK